MPKGPMVWRVGAPRWVVAAHPHQMDSANGAS